MLDLPIFPWPNEHLPAIKVAKATTDLPIVRPRAAVYGDKRVLATDVPDFLCNVAIVRSTAIQDIVWALDWVVTGSEDSRAWGFEDLLTNWCGKKVVETW
jgi:hypothetical protein